MFMNSKSTEIVDNITSSLWRSFTVTRRVIRQIFRDRRTLILLLIMPLIVMVVFGLALSGDINNIPVVVENADQGYPPDALPENQWFNYGTNITQQLKQDKTIDYHEGNYNTSMEEVNSGKYFAAIYIPDTFSEDLFNRLVLNQNVSVVIKVYIDVTKPTIRQSVLGAVNRATQDSLGADWIMIEEVIAHEGEDLTGLDTSIPSVMAFVLTFLVLLISGLTLIREKLAGTESRLYSTPLRASERLLGYTGALLVISLLISSVILIVGLGIFGTTQQGNFFLLIFAIIIYALLHVLLAVFLSNYAENELQAVQMAPLIALPSMAVTGMLIPINSLPLPIQYFSRIFPLYYGIRILEGIMLKSWDFSQLWVDFLVLFGMIILFWLLAMLTVRDKMSD